MATKGTTELMEFASFLKKAAGILQQSMSDGKVGLADAALLYRLKEDFLKAVEGADEIPSEISKITPEETARLLELLPLVAPTLKIVLSYTKPK